MAPKGGRGGGGGGSRGSSSSSSSCSSGDYPCRTDFRFIYGNGGTSIYSNAELYGQLVVYIIFALALVVLLLKSWKTPGARIIQSAMAFWIAALAFLCARFGLLIADAYVPIEYRYESAITDMLQYIGSILLFAAIIVAMQARKPINWVLWIMLLVVAGLGLGYVVLSFIVSTESLNHFKDIWRWHFSDRDFGLTYSKAQIERLKTNGSIGLAFAYLQTTVFDFTGDYLDPRETQVKLGLALDALTFLLALSLLVVAVLPLIKRSSAAPLRSYLLLIVATSGLILTTLFGLIVSAAFVYPNWKVVTDFSRWIDWDEANPGREAGDAPMVGFLRGYRTTVNGFPIAQAVIETLGIVVSCAAVVLLLSARSKETSARGLGEEDKYDGTKEANAPAGGSVGSKYR